MHNYFFLVDSNKDKGLDKSEITTGIISWDSKPQLSTNVDWGAPAGDLGVKTDDLDLKWSDDEGDKESDDSDGGLNMSIGQKKEDSKDEDDENQEEEELQQQIDIMAQQLKFIACLKIMMEELSTLATGFEVDGKFDMINVIYKINLKCFVYRRTTSLSVIFVVRKRSRSTSSFM